MANLNLVVQFHIGEGDDSWATENKKDWANDFIIMEYFQEINSYCSVSVKVRDLFLLCWFKSIDGVP